MMKYLKISNQGEIDPELITLMGASTKRDEGKIGRFGSGLKYSYAFMLRQHIPFRMFVGKKEIKFSLGSTQIGSKTFHRIVVNKRATDLSAEMGPDWNEWMTVREIFCNALDEGDARREILVENQENGKSNLKGETGRTTMYIGINEQILQVVEHWNNYFTQERKPLFVHQPESLNQWLGSIYPGDGKKTIVYHRGVRVYEANTPSIFHYELPGISINEIREVSNQWEMRIQISKLLMQIPSHLKELFLEHVGNSTMFEHRLDFDYMAVPEDWQQVLPEGVHITSTEMTQMEEVRQAMSTKKVYVLPPNLYARMLTKFDKSSVLSRAYSDYRMTDNNDPVIGKQVEDRIAQGVAWLASVGYQANLPFQVVNFKHGLTLAIASVEEKRYFVSPRVCSISDRELYSMIIEEHEHIRTGYPDKSREFQDHVFGMIVDLLAERGLRPSLDKLANGNH